MMTVLVVAVILCAMCLVFVFILYCCKSQLQGQAPTMMMAPQQMA
jgi:hypothetical protein